MHGRVNNGNRAGEYQCLPDRYVGVLVSNTKLAAINKRLGPAGNPRGLCNSVHPDAKYTRTVTESKCTFIDGKYQWVYVEKTVHDVVCSRFAQHTGKCSAFAFSIQTPDTWPHPADCGCRGQK